MVCVCVMGHKKYRQKILREEKRGKTLLSMYNKYKHSAHVHSW